MADFIPMLTPRAEQYTQQTPQNGTDTVNQASAQGIQQELHNNAVNNVRQSIASQAQQAGQFAQGLLDASPFTSENIKKTVMTKQYYNGLLKTKQDYANALANGDEQGMQNAAQMAQVYREGAMQDGVDISSVGQDKTLAQAQAARDVFNMRNYGTLFGGNADSGAVYNQLYEKARRAGMSEGGADEYAYGKAKDYQQRRLQALNDELYSQGINPNNSINSYGIQLISAMRGEDPRSAEVALQTFGVPLNEYTYDKKNQAADSAMERQIQALHANTGDKLQLIDAQGKNNRSIAEIQASANRYNADTQRAINNDKIAAQMKMAEMGVNPSTGKSNSKGVKLNESQNKIQNKINLSYRNLKRLLAQPRTKDANGEYAKVAPEEEADAMEDFRTQVEEAKNSGEFDVDTIDEWENLARMLYYSYQGKYGYTP